MLGPTQLAGLTAVHVPPFPWLPVIIVVIGFSHTRLTSLEVLVYALTWTLFV